jgi:hypothetical protein
LTKEFLGAQGIAFESVVISEQRDRWLASGSPPVPTLVVDGVPHVLQHPDQAAQLLGLEIPPALRDAVQVAWDVDAIAQAWLAVAERTPWPVLLESATRLGRTPLALTVDALVGISALTAALDSGWFHWPGNPMTGELSDASVVAYEASIVATIHTRGDLLAYAWPIAARWRDAIVAYGDDLRTAAEGLIGAPRGELTLVELLEAQRLHAAQHYRQATTSIEPTLDLATLHGLQLPAAID